jgi:hypothetical protein
VAMSVPLKLGLKWCDTLARSCLRSESGCRSCRPDVFAGGEGSGMGVGLLLGASDIAMSNVSSSKCSGKSHPRTLGLGIG